MKENSIEKDEEILNKIKAYMQENIDKGCHKFVYNDLGYDEKCVDVINAIEHLLSDYKKVLKENEEKDKIIDLLIKELYTKAHISTGCYLQTSTEECMKYKNCYECLKKHFEDKERSNDEKRN